MATISRGGASRGFLRVWRVPIIGSAMMGLIMAALVVWTRLDVVDLWPVALGVATFLALALFDRGFRLMRKRGVR